MKRNIRIVTGLVCGLFAVALAGCAKDRSLPEEGMSQLLVVGGTLEQTPENKDAQSSMQSRAAEINRIFTFEDGDALSLFMRGTNYDDVDNRKVAYSKPGTAAGTWAIAGTPIYLHDGTAVVSLVHPYTAGAAYDNIPFSTGVYTTGKDLLWKQQDVYGAASKAQVTQMKHALARVKLTIGRDEPTDTSKPDRFTGTGAVTAVSISNGTVATSPVIFTAGKLDLSFTAPASPVSGVTAGAVADAAAFTLSTSGHTTDLLTLPVAALAQNLVMINITVDGRTMTASLPFAAPAVTKWDAGTCYAYAITVKNSGIKITASAVDNWTTGTTGGGEVEKPVPPAPAVGDYYYSDGTFSTELASGKTPVGVIFWIDKTVTAAPYRYKVHSLDEADKQWCPENVDTYATDADDGMANMATIKAYNPDLSKYPAIKWCDDKNTGGQSGWYLPAKSELQYLWCVYNDKAPVKWDTVNPPSEASANTLAQSVWNNRLSATGVGGTPFESGWLYYLLWSSTEVNNGDALMQSFVDGCTFSEVKYNSYRIRCVRVN